MEEDMLDDLQPAFAEEEGDEDVDVVVAAPRSSAAAAAPARAPLQRSSLDDVPHGMRDRGDAMCRLDEAGSASSGPATTRERSASASGPSPEQARPLFEAWNRSGAAGTGVEMFQRGAASTAVQSAVADDTAAAATSC